MVELVDAPDSKSGGLRPLGVRVPLPALGFQWFSTFAVAVLDKIWTRKAPNAIYRRIFLPSAAQASRRPGLVKGTSRKRRSSPELCVKVRGSSSMLLLGCLGDLLRFEKREIQVATFAPDRSSP